MIKMYFHTRPLQGPDPNNPNMFYTCPLKGHNPNDPNVISHLSLAVLVGVQLLHPVGVAEGVQGVLARRHAGADHCNHTRSRLRVKDDVLW